MVVVGAAVPVGFGLLRAFCSFSKGGLQRTVAGIGIEIVFTQPDVVDVASSRERRPVNAITLPSGDQTGLPSLSGCREMLYGVPVPSDGRIQTSRLKSSSYCA